MFGRKKTSQGEESLPSEGLRTAAAPRSSRPDASAVLDRQPVPPVRRPTEYANAPQPAPRGVSRPGEGAPMGVAGAQQTTAERSESEGKKLIVGRGIRLSGEIRACEKLVVEGEVHADLSGALVLEIAENGLFKGRATVDYAEISGSFDGELTVRDRLLLRSSGQIDGDLRYAVMEIERGGRVRGTIGELDESQPKGKEKASQAGAKGGNEAGGRRQEAPAAAQEEASAS